VSVDYEKVGGKGEEDRPLGGARRAKREKGKVRLRGGPTTVPEQKICVSVTGGGSLHGTAPIKARACPT